MEKIIRVRKIKIQEKIQALRDAGFSAESSKEYSWFNGLSGLPSTARYYISHECERHPEEWIGIRTNASGRKAHKVWREAGLVRKQW